MSKVGEPVKAGVSSVRITLDHLEAIRERITHVATSIQEVGRLSLAQAETSGQVGQMMDQTNNRIAQNAAATHELAATVQEMARTSDDLAQVGEGLYEVVKGFKL